MVGANAGIAKTKQKKYIVFVERRMQCSLLQLKSQGARDRGKHLAIQLLWASARLFVTRLSIFVPGIAERNKEAG